MFSSSTMASRQIVVLVHLAFLIAAHGFQVPLTGSRGRTTALPSLKPKEAQVVNLEQLYKLNQCESGTAARQALESALDTKTSLYSSVKILQGAAEKGISDAELAIQTKIRNNRYTIMELIELNGDKDADRASLALLGIMVASVTSALVAEQNLPGPEIIRFLVVWIFSFSPLFFVGYGLATPEKLQTLLVSLQREIFPVYRKRMIQHEAGHFLMGHLLGMPVKGYATNAVKNAVEFYPLNDPQIGRDRVSLLGFTSSRTNDVVVNDDPPVNPDAPFFSKEGRGSEIVEKQSVFRNAKNYTENPFLKLPSANEPTNSWPFRGFDEETIDKLAVVSVAGVCAEILAFGNAEGGYADLSQLRQLFNSAQADLTDRDMERRIRYSLGFTMSQLRLHLGALDALADAMARDASVAECVMIIESCENVSGGDGIMGDYDLRRRESFRSGGIGMIEKFFLDGKNADTAETRVVEGAGGGDKKEGFAITGDDPLYAAIAMAFVFFTWASQGGLSLH
jgi:hypothetical protein